MFGKFVINGKQGECTVCKSKIILQKNISVVCETYGARSIIASEFQ